MNDQLRIAASRMSVSVIGVEGTASASRTGRFEQLGRSWFLNRVLINQPFRGVGHGSRYLAEVIAAAWKQEPLDIVVTPGGYDTPPRWLFRWYRARGFQPLPDHLSFALCLKCPWPLIVLGTPQMHTESLNEHEGTFKEPMDTPRKCRKCGKKTVTVQQWSSNCGGYEDYKYSCSKEGGCGFHWWVEGPDA